MQPVPESFGSIKEDCGSLKKKKETRQIKVYLSHSDEHVLCFLLPSICRMLSEANLCSVSKNMVLIRVCIVMGETISIENVHLLGYI